MSVIYNKPIIHTAKRADSVAFWNKKPLFSWCEWSEAKYEWETMGRRSACSVVLDVLLSWGIQFRLLLLDAVRSNDVFLMLFSTCSVPLKITKQKSCDYSLETCTELSISWLLVLILLSIDVKMSQFTSKCKYFPKSAPKTTSNVVHW